MHPVILVEGSSATINYRMWTVMIVYVHVPGTWSCKCSYTLSAFVFSMERFTTSPLMHLTKWWMRKWKKNQSPRKKEKRRKMMKKRRRRRSVIKLIFFFQICYLQFLLQCLVAYDDFILQGLKSYFVQTYLIWIDG